jgi:hypothetical protein
MFKKQEFQINFAKTNDDQEIYYEERGNEKGPIVLFQLRYMGVIQT